MRGLIRSRTRDGAVQERTLDVEALTFGRGAENAVQLPGLLVAPLHARIVVLGPGQFRLDSKALAGVTVNGIPGVKTCELLPGDRLEIAGHSIEVLPPAAGADLAIEVQLGETDRALGHSGARTDLRAAGLQYRKPAMVLAAVVIVLGFLLPLASHLLPARWWPFLLPSDRVWTAGRISAGHSHFGSSCGTCHETLFVRVRDSACTSCHTNVAHHSEHPEIRTVDGFDGVRCATCHHEHDAVKGLAPRDPAVCTSCHASPDFKEFPDLRPAKDFGKAHPPFRPRVSARLPDGSVQVARREQSPELKDWGGLLYNHALHVDAKGVKGPEKLEQMQCADCHVPDATRTSFLPVKYETHCARCHTLDTTLNGAAVKLPHGSEDLLRVVLDRTLRQRPAAAAPAADEEPDDARRRAGEGAQRGGLGGFAEQAQQGAFRLCSKCHELVPGEGDLPHVRPPRVTESWLPAARFTHAQHEAVKCAQCHAAAQSQFAEDLLLPTLGDCRVCHGGVHSSSGVASTCIDCHRLHQAGLPWTADASRRGVVASEAQQPKP
ncbi:MAG TPA: cytochrome c3 family protein [Candidatus Binatia bacterium]|nr:cytochrome c3 family protein [Candidatus Binatia bacterium]